MKKAVITLVALLAAGMTNAAVVAWGGTATDETDALLTSGQAYLVYAGADGVVDATWDETTQTWLMDDDVVVASSAYGTSSTTAGTYGKSTAVGTPAGSVYYVIVTDAGTAGTTLPTTIGSYYGISGTETQTKGGATDINVMDLGTTKAGTEITPIPEPSTVALALVGVAAVALRRKFMKK